jgi:sec-independent protein translocase protein TatB
VFNLQGSELIIILLLALVVLGPEKLPEAMRKMGEFYGQLKKMSSGFQQEFRAATQEPMREVRDTANVLRDSVDFRKLAAGERDEKPKSGEMAAAPEVPVIAPVEQPEAPTEDVPFTSPDEPVSSTDEAHAGRGQVDITPESLPESPADEPVDESLTAEPASDAATTERIEGS